ncbi:hypothetical protein Cs7R123_01310 [Catellatospora sp. TT07R-123]|uniref:hypothetical protein n=1 Tax=Catellatospora sp. TT07R-123 TaxID=2733863 RepID=UPI001B199211|nr:hypothetical protein [Catellatospora sp. TT07R-123]GHJ42789.1 hypothetical protein Cs7R123_01310 [Catellatospora sp. TT07R-123]
MAVFTCAGCGAALTVPVRRVVLPAHARARYGNGPLDVLMEPGTYAIDPLPSGPPWRLWAEVDAAEAASHGVYAPTAVLSFGPAGAVAVAPGDVRGTEFIPDRLDGTCCGLSAGRGGPNLACARCGLPVATRVDDCGLWQAVWLAPGTVDIEHDAADGTSTPWEELLDQQPGLPPVEQPGHWSPLWQASLAVTLAHVVTASGGHPVAVAVGPTADVLRRALDALLPTGPTARILALAGPGLPEVAADIAVVPQHPQTGELWAPVRAPVAAPLSWEVWAYLAFHRERKPVPIPAQAFRDDPPPRMPFWTFRPSRSVFLDTLVRLPGVREPWLRAIYDRVNERWAGLPLW